MRKLKYHEQKFLKKLNFLHYEEEDELYEKKIIKKYHIQERDDYRKYKKICVHIHKLTETLKQLEPRDSIRINLKEQLLNKLYHTGIIDNQKKFGTIKVANFAKRRLASIMVKNKMIEKIADAARFIEQGHVRVGTDTITDPAYHINRNFEDYITWVDTSKIKRKILRYNDNLDDYDILN